MVVTAYFRIQGWKLEGGRAGVRSGIQVFFVTGAKHLCLISYVMYSIGGLAYVQCVPT